MRRFTLLPALLVPLLAACTQSAPPSDTTPGTRLRIAEVLGGTAPSTTWR